MNIKEIFNNHRENISNVALGVMIPSALTVVFNDNLHSLEAGLALCSSATALFAMHKQGDISKNPILIAAVSASTTAVLALNHFKPFIS